MSTARVCPADKHLPPTCLAFHLECWWRTTTHTHTHHTHFAQPAGHHKQSDRVAINQCAHVDFSMGVSWLLRIGNIIVSQGTSVRCTAIFPYFQSRPGVSSELYLFSNHNHTQPMASRGFAYTNNATYICTFIAGCTICGPVRPQHPDVRRPRCGVCAVCIRFDASGKRSKSSIGHWLTRAPLDDLFGSHCI